MFEPPANMVGGSSTPLGRPVVPDVYIRLGRGATSVGGSLGSAAASQLSHGVRPSSARAAPADDERHPGLAGGGQAGLHRLRTHEEHAGAGVLEDVGHLLRVEVEVDRHRRDAGQQPAEVGQHGLGAVLGEDRGPLLRAQVERPQAVGDAVERVADLGPPQGHAVVAEGDLVGSLVGQARGDRRHRQVSISPIGSPTS